MKIVIQNGSHNLLTRKEVESMVPLFPASWNNRVEIITLYQGKAVTSEYYKKQKALGLFSPSPESAETPKIDLIDELLISLSSIADGVDSPNSLNRSKRMYYGEKVSDLKAKCLNAIT